jgi:Protein of unknown function DUF262
MITTATNMTVGDLVNRLRTSKLIPRPNFQRKLVWQNKDRLAFLDTVINGFPFPEIYISAQSIDTNTGESIYQLVDGQQRITTLAQYMNASDDLKLTTDIKPYNDLSPEEKLSFVQYKVVVRDLGNISQELVIEIFTRINSTNYSLNAIEIQNAQYRGEFKQLAENLSDNSLFSSHNVFSLQEGRRMQDVQFMLSVLTTITKGYFNRNKLIEETLREYNEEFPQKDSIQNNILNIFKLIEDANLGENSRVWGKADLFTLIVELYRYILAGNTIDIKVFGDKARQFYDRIESEASRSGIDSLGFAYYQAAFQAVNDRSKRVARGDIFRDEVLHKL